MSNVDQALRSLPVESREKGGTDEILYFLNEELLAVVRKLRRFVNASFGKTVELVAGEHRVSITDEFLRADAVDGVIPVTLLPSSEAVLGVRMLTIKKLDSSANPVTWTVQGDDDVDGASSGSLTAQYQFVRLRPRTGGYDIA